MKKSTLFLFANLLISVCMAEAPLGTDPMLNNAMQLAKTLDVPLISKSPVWDIPLFHSEEDIYTNGVRIAVEGAIHAETTYFCVYSNAQVIAGGILFERPTFDEARTALMLELVNNSMMLEALASIYIVKTDGIGDFSVVRKTRDKVTDAIIESPSWICFIRGAKAIRLRGEDGANINVRPIAEVLDELLKRPPDQRTGKEFPAPKPPEEKR